MKPLKQDLASALAFKHLTDRGYAVRAPLWEPFGSKLCWYAPDGLGEPTLEDLDAIEVLMKVDANMGPLILPDGHHGSARSVGPDNSWMRRCDPISDVPRPRPKREDEPKPAPRYSRRTNYGAAVPPKKGDPSE